MDNCPIFYILFFLLLSEAKNVKPCLEMFKATPSLKIIVFNVIYLYSIILS